MPGLGVFAQADSWEGDIYNPQSLNPYFYTLGNPLNYTDPSGNETLEGDALYPCLYQGGGACGDIVVETEVIDPTYDSPDAGDLAIAQAIDDALFAMDSAINQMGNIVSGSGYEPFASAADSILTAREAGWGRTQNFAEDVVMSAIPVLGVTHKDALKTILGEVAEKVLKYLPRGTFKFFGNEAIIHFEKHGKEIMSALGKTEYNIKDYIDDANNVIKNGTWVPERNAYVLLIGGRGSAKAAFVGLNQAGNITTFHIKSVKELAKIAPSLGFSP